MITLCASLFNEALHPSPSSKLDSIRLHGQSLQERIHTQETCSILLLTVDGTVVLHRLMSGAHLTW